MTTPGPATKTQVAAQAGPDDEAPADGRLPHGTARGTARGTDAGRGGRVPAPGRARPAEPARHTRLAIPAPRAATQSWGLPMTWLADHLPLTLIMDLSMPFGPHSRELLVEEPPPATAS